MDIHRHPKDLKVINIWAGPGSGKSTTAAGLFNLMKHLGYRVELVTEVAKDLTYERNFGTLTNQLLLLGAQDNRLRRLVGEVDFAITDSPLPLCEAYMTPEYAEWLPDAVDGAFDRYDNYSFFIKRVKPYATYGRTQSEPAAIALDSTIRSIYAEYAELDYCEVPGDAAAPELILTHLRSMGVA